jgi:DNA-binding NtrC family response regulator
MATSHADLEALVGEGSFRADLLQRLGANRVAVPPLRDRSGDVLLLAEYFVQSVADRARKEVTGLSAEAAERLAAHDWPGNVRELRTCIERAVFLSRSKVIEVSDLPETFRSCQSLRSAVRGGVRDWGADTTPSLLSGAASANPPEGR